MHADKHTHTHTHTVGILSPLRTKITVVVVVVVVKVTQVCPTLAAPWTVACQAPLSMGFSRQEYWSGIINTLFQQLKRRLYTWTSPDGQH